MKSSCATALLSCTPPSVPAQPSLASFKKLPKGAAAAVRSAALLKEFEAAPWLLPGRTPSLPYAGVHNLDALLRMRARPAGGYDKAVALLLFSAEWALMAQNSIYSLVKHAGVRNYVAVTWTQQDLEACADLNLPCADASALLRRPVDKGRPSSADYVAMSWIKPAVLQRALEQEYVVMLADTDIAYTVKPLWESYMAYVEQAEADGAWMQEEPAPNTGHFVVLPTQASLAFVRAWNAVAPDMSGGTTSLTDQKTLPRLEGNAFMRCDTVCRCLRTSWNLTRTQQREGMALFRTYLPGHYAYSPNRCTAGSPLWMPRLDPCDWHVLYLHPICIADPTVKQRALQAAGFWFIDDAEGCRPQPGAASRVPACRPLRWRDDSAEVAHYSCHSYQLGLVHGGDSAGLTAVKSGVTAYSEKSAAELFGLDVYASLFC